MTETLLIIHILAAAAWIGGGLLSGFLGPSMGAAGGETAINWIKSTHRAATRYYIPAATLTLLSGVGLVLVEEAYDWGAPFVWIGLVVVVLAAGAVSTILVPSAQKALTALEAGDFPSVAPHARRAGLTGRIIVILLMLAEVTMVLRLGA
jgi:hypothetical protein